MIVRRERDRIVRTLAGLALILAVSAAPGAGGLLAATMGGSGLESAEAGGPGGDAARRPPPGVHMIRHWNKVAIDMSGLDHTPVPPADPVKRGEQLGPGRASRAMAIVHIAVFDAVNAIVGGYRGYTDIPRARRNTSMEAAVAQAAHDTLVALFPAQKAACDAQLTDDLGQIRRGIRKTNGIDLGRRAAAAILARRAGDGSDHPEPQFDVDYFPGQDPGVWRMDPISQLPVALGARWHEVTPFVLPSADHFRVPPPPDLNSPEYTAAYNEAKALGGDGVVTPTSRTAEQSFIGIYWAYDGTPSLCAPPRLYNQIAMQIADEMRTDAVETARFLALINVAMADAGIAIWESKYFYEFWRPVGGIRESDPGTGPTGAGDGNPNTSGDPAWKPLGAPASNSLVAVDFTPPFPAYPSGHAGFGGALFQTIRNFFGTDDIPFTFVSDEFNGVTLDNDGSVRPLMPRSFDSLSQAEEENGQSRIYLGIHWRFDKTEGIAQGREVADYVFDNAFQPEP